MENYIHLFALLCHFIHPLGHLYTYLATIHLTWSNDVEIVIGTWVYLRKRVVSCCCLSSVSDI